MLFFIEITILINIISSLDYMIVKKEKKKKKKKPMKIMKKKICTMFWSMVDLNTVNIYLHSWVFSLFFFFFFHFFRSVFFSSNKNDQSSKR